MTGVLAIGLLPLTVSVTLSVVGLLSGNDFMPWSTAFGVFGWGIYLGGWIRGWADR